MGGEVLPVEAADLASFSIAPGLRTGLVHCCWCCVEDVIL